MKKDDVFERQLFSLTTIINTEFEANGNRYSGTASGFYYTEMTPTDPSKKGPQWHKIEGQWLITNRHVIFPNVNGTEYFVDKFVFCLRKQSDAEIKWVPITLNAEQLRKLTKIHKDPDVDVVAIDVSQLIMEKIKQSLDENNQSNLMIPGALSNINLPENQPLVIDVTSDIIVASYPKGFYVNFS